MTIETTEGAKGQRGIMARELSQTEIIEFIASNGLDLDMLDEREETLEAWRQECNLLIRGFVNYLGNRFSAIEHRLDRLEQQVEERYGYQKDGICP
ncbi:MAG: hypothetical protein ABSH06_15350 [Thermodesulfobacteriota bacterium]|jgi:hypothetical protein